MSEQAVPFYEMFDCCKDNEDLAGILQQAQVISAIIDRTELTMRINIRFAAPVPPVFLSMIENEISEEFELKSVKIFQFSKNLGKKKEVKKSKNKILF